MGSGGGVTEKDTLFLTPLTCKSGFAATHTQVPPLEVEWGTLASCSQPQNDLRAAANVFGPHPN